MSTGGPEFYKKAFIDLDTEALGSDTMKEAFDRMTVIRGYRRRQLLGPRLEPRLAPW